LIFNFFNFEFNMERWLHNYLSPDDIEVIKQEIRRVEQSTSGQIRLSIRERRSFWEKLYQPHELAVKDFEKLGIANTKQKTGILIFIILDERYYDILADEGIHEKINDHIWVSIEEKLKDEFPKEGYLNGILHIIDKMGEVLKLEFPRTTENVDELSDEVVVQ
jgi:uncharacterized membrane protein